MKMSPFFPPFRLRKSSRFTKIAAVALACLIAAHSECAPAKNASQPSFIIPLHKFTYAGEQRLAIYVGVNGGQPLPYLFDTGSSIFEAVVTTNAPYDPDTNPVNGVTPINGVTGDKDTYPDFGYAYGDGNGFSGTLATTTVSFYAHLSDTNPIVTYTNAAGSTNGIIVNAIAEHYLGTNIDTNYWPSIAINLAPIEEGNIVGTFGAGPFVSDRSYDKLSSDHSDTKKLSNGITYGSVLGQITGSGYIVDATSSNPTLTIGLNSQLISQFTNAVAANPSTNPDTTNFPGSLTPAFDSQEINLYETLSGIHNTRKIKESTFLTNLTALLDTGTANFQIPLDTNTVTNNSFVYRTTHSTNIFAGNILSGTTLAGPFFSITTSTNNFTDTVGLKGSVLGIGLFLQNSVMFDLADGLIGFLNPAPPHYDHIVLVILENHGYDELATNDLPFINGVLRAGGADMTQSYSLQHPSQDNYYWLFSGDNQGVASDYLGPTFSPTNATLSPFTSAPNLYTELAQAKKSFGGYLDAYPGANNIYAAGVTTNGVNYVVRHVPWLGFKNVPAAKVTHNFTTFGTTAASFAKLPAVSFVIPGLEHDMHDWTNGEEVSDVTNSAIAMTNSDAWLSANLGAYAAWAVANNSLLIITTDEDSTADWTTPPNPDSNYHDSNPVALTAPTASFSHTATNYAGAAQSGPNQITTIFYGANIIPGSYDEGEGITHVNVLRTIEWLCGLTNGVGAQSSAVTTIGESPVTDIFAGFTGSDNFAGTKPDTNSWFVNVSQSSSNDILQQNNGLHFIVPVMQSSSEAAWAWTTNAPVTSDWSITLHVGNLSSSTVSTAFSQIGLSVRNPNPMLNLGFGMALAFDRHDGGREWKANLDQGTNSSVLTTTNSAVSKGNILLTYTSANGIVTAAYATPSTKQRTWVSLATATLDDLGLSTNNPAASSFVITIDGDASGMKLTPASGVSANNFLITTGATPVISSKQ